MKNVILLLGCYLIVTYFHTAVATPASQQLHSLSPSLIHVGVFDIPLSPSLRTPRWAGLGPTVSLRGSAAFRGRSARPPPGPEHRTAAAIGSVSSGGRRPGSRDGESPHRRCIRGPRWSSALRRRNRRGRGAGGVPGLCPELGPLWRKVYHK